MLEIRFSDEKIMQDIIKAIQATPEYVSNGAIVNDKENYMIIGKINPNHVVIDLSDWIMTKGSTLPNHSEYHIDRFA